MKPEQAEKVFSKIDKHGYSLVALLALLIFIGMLGIAVIAIQLNRTTDQGRFDATKPQYYMATNHFNRNCLDDYSGCISRA